MTPRASIELFHLVFLRALTGGGQDKSRIALKGGCNLRFFFGSVRYSEDIDFDVGAVPKETLKKKVERVLDAPLVRAPLRAAGLELADVSAPKQTETTQRWKVGIGSTSGGSPLRTKLEFSRRRTIEGAVFEATPISATRPYSLTPVLASHYDLRTAIAQKVHALAERAEPQARDVFDLAHLFGRAGAEGVALKPTEKVWIEPALRRAASMTFDAYVATVVAYLDPELAGTLRSREAWRAIEERVSRGIEALR